MDQVSWLGQESVKQKYLEQITAHEKADAIIKGRYWEDGKGCAVGCLIHGSKHELFEREMGIPEWCARLIDRIFEGLLNEQAKLFPRRFVEAVPVGKDEAWWNRIKCSFLLYIQRENLERVEKLDFKSELKEQVLGAIRGCEALFVDALETGVWDESAAWSAAESAARSAESVARLVVSAESAESAAESAESAAWSAAESAARSAESVARLVVSAWSAWSVAESAARSAWSAWSAWSVAESAESAAESADLAAYGRYRDELLRLLRESDK